MGTTVWIDEAVRRALRERQEQFGARSVNETIRRLLEAPGVDARTLFLRHGKEIKRILDRHRVRKLIAFGSRARGDARPDSDLDLAVEMPANANPLAILALEADLEELLEVKVDLVELPNARLRPALEREGVRFGA